MQTLQRKVVYTTGEVARICHVAPRTVSKWVDNGQLRGYRIPGSRDRRIPVDHLQAFMRAHGMPIDLLDAGPCRVLIVDADAPLELAEAMNGDDRFEVRTASNDFEAGLLAQQFHPNAIVLDVAGAIDDAVLVCRNIKENSALAGTKVLAAGADLGDAQQQELRQFGFDGFLGKKYSPAQLAKVMGV